MVVFFLRSFGFRFDSRLRKEISTVVSAGDNVRVFGFDYRGSFAKIENFHGSKLFLNFSFFSLFSQYLKKSAIRDFLEILDELVASLVFIALTRPRKIVVHDHRQFLLVLFIGLIKKLGLKIRIVWDLREIPPPIFFGRLRPFFGLALRLVDHVFCANQLRLDLLRARFDGVEIRGSAICNFVERNFVDETSGIGLAEFPKRLLDKPWVYCQNPCTGDRLFFETALACEEAGLVLGVSGGVHRESRDKLIALWGAKRYGQVVVELGFVSEQLLSGVIDKAAFSIILYRADAPNREYADANRLYQSLGRGIPVVVGSNPGLTWLVRKTGAGVMLRGDGSHVEDVVSGLRKMCENLETYRHLAYSNRDVVIWELQVDKIAKGIYGEVKE